MLTATTEAPAKVEAQPGSSTHLPPAGNISVEELARRRTLRRQAPSNAAGEGTGQAPESALESLAPAAPSATEDAPAPAPTDGTQPTADTDTEEPPALMPGDSIEQLITDAIANAAAAPDRAEAIKRMSTRIAAIAQQRDDLAQRVAQLEAKPPQAQPAATPTATPATPENMFADATLAQMDGQIRNLQQALEHIAANPDGFTYQHEGQEVTMDATQLRAAQTRYSAELGRLITQREIHAHTLQQQAIAHRAESDRLAAKAYPWLTRNDAPETQLARAELAALPEPVRQALKQLPGFNLFVARYTRGLLAERAESQRPVTPARPASRGSTPPTAVPKVSAKAPAVDETRYREAEALARRTGRVEHLAHARTLKRQLATS